MVRTTILLLASVLAFGAAAEDKPKEPVANQAPAVSSEEAAQDPAVEKATPAEKPEEGESEASTSDSFEGTLVILDKALVGVEKLALIRPEATGTIEDLSGVEEKIQTYLSGKEKLLVIPGEQVFKKVGPEFPVTPEGIAGVAKKMEANAALFARVFKTAREYELHLWLVDADGKVLLDETVKMQSIPPGKTPAVAEQPETPAPRVEETPAEPDPPPPEADPHAEAVEAYHRRALSIAPRQRIVGGGTMVGFGTRHVSVGVHSGPVITTDWMVVEGATPISEGTLAEMAGREDLSKRIERDIGAMKTYRNVGIGMTLAGFIAAGVATPFFKEGTDEGLTAAGVAVGVGSAVGISGLVLWLIYGPQVAKAQSPYPASHLVTQEEAEQMIESYNGSLRRELGLGELPGGAETPVDAPPLRFTIMPDFRGGASAALEFRF